MLGAKISPYAQGTSVVEPLGDDVTEIVLPQHIPAGESVQPFPASVRKLDMSVSDFNEPIDPMPGRLEELVLNRTYSHSLDSLPGTVKRIRLYAHQQTLVPPALASTVETME